MLFPQPIKKLIDHFSRLPGLGPKTAERLALYLVKQDKNRLTDFGHTLLQVRDKIRRCELCGQISEQKLCSICTDKNRDHSTICIVADEANIPALEKSAEFNGVYHLLNGLLNPTEGITPDKLRLKELEQRIKNSSVKEIILALNPTIEGETTTLFLTKILKKYNLKISRLARGLPQGGDLEYADEITLANAFKGRTLI